MAHDRPLTLIVQRFIEFYLADPNRNGAAAYRKACPEVSVRSSGVTANKWLRDPRVRAEIERRQKEAEDSAPVTRDLLARHLAELVKADPRDLIEHRRGACRYCYGQGFQHQHTPQEMRERVADYKTKNPEDPLCLLFDPKGGVGFNPNKDPHPECPECFGRGEGYTYAKDLRHVSSAAARLFATIEETQHGLKVRVRNQDKSLEMALRHLGMFLPDDDDKDVPPAATVSFNRVDASQ